MKTGLLNIKGSTVSMIKLSMTLIGRQLGHSISKLLPIISLLSSLSILALRRILRANRKRAPSYGRLRVGPSYVMRVSFTSYDLVS